MVSRPLSRADLINQVESFLDDSNVIWSAARLGLLLDDAITEASEAVPFVMRDVYTIESRTGTATSTSPNNLVDSGRSQFLSGDAGKMVYNVKDKTWAVIESRTDADTVVLSKDIFTSGEQYEIYNKGCWSSKQINIEDSDDFLWIIGAVYPVQPDFSRIPLRNMRNVVHYDQNKIVELDVAFVDDTKNADADKDVHLYLARQHKLNPMTDLAGKAKTTAAAVATSMTVDNLQSTSGSVFKDTLFTVATATGISGRLTYRVTADATISTSEATISFFPALEAEVAATQVITFIGSTLTPDLERIIVQIIIGEAMMSQAVPTINTVEEGGAGVSNRYYQSGERIAEKARARLKGMIDVDERATYIHSRV